MNETEETRITLYRIPLGVRVLRVVCYPVHVAADLLHMRFSKFEKKHWRFVVGLAFMTTGSTIAVSSGSWGLPHPLHIMVDVIAYFIHGLGCAPFMQVIVAFLNLEG